MSILFYNHRNRTEFIQTFSQIRNFAKSDDQDSVSEQTPLFQQAKAFGLPAEGFLPSSEV
jgi:hypothetical protein